MIEHEEIIFSLSKIDPCEPDAEGNKTVGCPCGIAMDCGPDMCCANEDYGAGGHDNSGSYDQGNGCTPYNGEPAIPSPGQGPDCYENATNSNSSGGCFSDGKDELCCPSGCCPQLYQMEYDPDSPIDPATGLPSGQRENRDLPTWVCCPDNSFCASHVCHCPNSFSIDECKSVLSTVGLSCKTVGNPCSEGQTCTKVDSLPPSPGECKCVSSYLFSRIVEHFNWKGDSPP